MIEFLKKTSLMHSFVLKTAKLRQNWMQKIGHIKHCLKSCRKNEQMAMNNDIFLNIQQFDKFLNRGAQIGRWDK